MRIVAFMVGMFGGFVGVYFAQLIVAGTAVLGAFASALGGKNAGEPLTWALVALGCYTLGIIGGALAIQRPSAAAVLMLLAAVGGGAASLGVGSSAVSLGGGPAPTAGIFATSAPTTRSLASTPSAGSSDSPSGAQIALALLPYAGPALLAVGAILAASSRSEDDIDIEDEAPLDRTGRRRFVPPERAAEDA